MKKKLLICILFFCKNTLSKVLIFTFAHNRTDFIEIQHHTFSKFLTDDYEFVVFNDAIDHHIEQNIKDMCNKYNLRHVRIPKKIHTYPYMPHEPEEVLTHPTVRNVTAVQYALDTLGYDHNDILVLLDSDLFLTKPFSFRHFLKDYDLGGMCLTNGHVEYLWHGLAILDMSKLPDKKSLTFNCGRVNGKSIDAGGHSYYYLNKHPNLKIHWIENYYFSNKLYCKACQNNNIACKHNKKSLQQIGFNDIEIELMQNAQDIEIYQNFNFLHYRAGTNWNYCSNEYHQQKTAAFHTYLEKILN